MLLQKSKRLFLTISIILLFFTHSFGQVLNDYRSKASGAWSNFATVWERHNGTTWVAATASPTSGTANNITILSTHNVSIGAATTADQLTIASGGTITINATFTLTIANGATDLTIASGGSLVNNGTLLLSASTSSTNNGTILNSGTITPTGILTHGATGLYQHSFSSAAAAFGTIPASTWNAGSTCEILACGNSGTAPGGLNQSFRNFIWNNTTQPIDVNLNGALNNILGNFTMTSSATFKLILKTSSGSGTTVNGNTIINGGHLVIEHNATAFAGNNTLSIGGTFSQTGGICSLTTSTGSAVGSNGSGFLNVTGVSTISGGTLNITSSAWTGAAGGDGLFSATSDITLSGTGVINISTSGSTGNVGNGTITTLGSFTMSAGTLNLSSSTTTGGGGQGIFNIGGNFTHTGGTISKSGANSGIINIDGTAALQSIESIGFNAPDVIAFNISQTGTFGCNIPATKTFVLNTGTTLTINDNASVVTDFTIDGTLTANTNTWLCDPLSLTNFSSTGVFINNSTGVISTNSTASSLTFAALSIFRVAGNGGEVATATWNATSIVQVQGITTATTLGNGGQNFGRIDWNSTGQTSSCDFGAAGFGVITDYTITSTGTGVVRFPDVDFTLGSAAAATNRLILLGSSVLQVSNAPNLYATGNRTITINGNLSVASTSTIKIGSPNTGVGSYVANQTKDFTLVIKRNLAVTSTTPLVCFDHRSFAAFGDESYHLLFLFNGNVAQTIALPVSASNMVTTSGDGVANSGTDDEFTNTNAYSITVSGTTTLTLATASVKSHEFIVGSGSTLSTSIAALNLIDYSLLTSSGAVDNPSTIVSGTINFAATAGTATLTDASGTGTFTLNSGGTLITKHTGGITSTGSGLTGCVQVTGTRSYSSGANYTYNSALAQVTGNGLPTSLTAGTTLTIAHTGAITTLGVTLTQATTTAGALTLTQGRLITTSTNIMTIAAGGTSSVGAANAFVDGPIKKIGNTAFVFPTGDVYTATGPVNTAKWARIEITAPSVITDAFTAEYDKLNDPCNVNQAVSNVNGPGINHVSYKEYWNLTRDAGSSAPHVKLYWETGSISTSLGSAISSISSADLHVAEFYSGQWNDHGAGATSGVAAGPGTILTSIAPSFTTGVAMPFTFSAPNIINPLPLELTTFTGYPTSDGNQLEWSTASETNNNYFDIERSVDGTEFTKIATVNGSGNSTNILNYNLLDAAPVLGINYYRLKQVDFDEQYTFSTIISIEYEASENTVIQVYPNPSNDLVNIVASENIASFAIYNMLGELVFTAASNHSRIQFNPLSKGIYLVKAFTQDGKVSSTRFVRN